MDPAVTVRGKSAKATKAAPILSDVAPSAETPVVAQAETAVRRSRVEMTKVDLWSVLKVSLCFYLAGLAMVIIAGLVVWLLLDASGGIHNFEKFMGDIMSAKDYRLVASQILLGAVLVGLVIVALMTIITVIAASLYNLFSELVGGVEVTLVEAD
ncbi:MAG: DUF3566 domain-containing protein [Acidimicrobiia bacterium]